MKKLMSYEIREKWLEFWKSKGHDIIESAPLIPRNDPTLLWINAGVTPLKKYFDGSEIPNNRRMANAQKSIRTNDIDNVGKTARHHTFFEMLGNFSIGDYFRNEVIPWAYEVLMSDKWFGFDADKLYITYYPDDLATKNKWMEVGIKESHLIPLASNFWEIGEGPCGPDTEIFFDRGIKYDKENIGPKMIADDIENERYIEIWNIVFSQYNSKLGTPREKYKELPSKNIDTGMGLERMACVLQETPTNYETDLFMPIINNVEEKTGIKYNGQMAFKVIADHVRSVVFALSDGATFSNEGRGYVLRRLLRRAMRYGRLLGMNHAFLYELVKIVINNMKSFYPYLLEKEVIVTKQIKLEEEKFLLTLASGEKRLLEVINKEKENKVITKEVSFLLYDTFGFPFELTKEISFENGFTVDEEGFKEQLLLQKQRARQARNRDQSMNVQNEEMMKFSVNSEFVGYDVLSNEAKVIGIFKDGKKVVSAKGEIVVCFDKTCFYAESGGQNGDIGTISINGMNYTVINTIKMPQSQHASIIDMREDFLNVGDIVSLDVDEEFRSNTAKNHSATHLLNESLRQVVGGHIFQQGSNVTNNLLRFDFNNFEALTNEQILAVEKMVNDEIKNAHPVITKIMNINDAKKENAQAVFGEKYGSVVRVVDMQFSKELCGGTHVENTIDIKKFAITSIETKGSGIFRIEGATANNIDTELDNALINVNKEITNIVDKINNLVILANNNNIKLDYKEYQVSNAIESYQMIINRHHDLEILKSIAKDLEKEINRKLKENASLSINDFIDKCITINGVNLLVAKLENVNLDNAKDLIDRLSDKLENSIIFMAIINDNKVVFICKNKTNKVEAGLLVKQAAIKTLGNGGGRKDFAQAGGKNIDMVDEALNDIINKVKEVI